MEVRTENCHCTATILAIPAFRQLAIVRATIQIVDIAIVALLDTEQHKTVAASGIPALIRASVTVVAIAVELLGARTNLIAAGGESV